MNPRLLRNLLWLSTGLLLAAGAVWLILCWAFPYDLRISQDGATLASAVSNAESHSHSGLPTVDALTRVSSLPLRQRLFDPPPPDAIAASVRQDGTFSVDAPRTEILKDRAVGFNLNCAAILAKGVQPSVGEPSQEAVHR